MTDKEDKFSTGGAFDLYAKAADDDKRVDDRFVGEELGGYRITELIAEGGMGRVYRAERIDGSFERDVAIKLSVDSDISLELKERFSLEQSILASLNHPNICQLFDAGVTGQGWPYYVMELVDGQRIDEYCRDRNTDVQQIVELMIQITDAIAFAHARLVVHRDLKPSNVMVVEDGRPKVLDFGIAKLLDTGAAETRLRPMTPGYASPEQLLGKEITIASDVYQLGALLAEILTGRALTVDETLEQAIERAAAERPFTLSAEFRKEVPRELRQIIEQCLRSDPEQRYPDANALKQDLESFRDELPVSAVGITPAYRISKFLQRNRAAIASTAGVSLALAGAVHLSLSAMASNPCTDPVSRLAGIWDGDTRSAVISSFGATGLTYASTLANRVVNEMDGYAEAWRQMHVEACEASRVFQTQSDELFDKRMMCLQDYRTRMGAVSRRFAVADRATLDSVPRALDSLATLDRCADTERLAATVAPPEDELAQEIDLVKSEAAEVRADYMTGHTALAAEKLADIRALAVATGYEPVIAEVELLAGQILADRSEDEAIDAFVSAISNAAIAGDDYRLAESWIEYAYTLSEKRPDREASRAHLLSAKAAVLRLDNEATLAMALANTEGTLAYRSGELESARDHFTRALELAESEGLARSDPLRLNLATVYRELGDFEHSRELSQKTFDIVAARDGPDSLNAIRALDIIAVIAKEQNDHATAIAIHRQVLGVYVENFGEDHAMVANAKRKLAWSLKETGRLQEALALMEDALAIHERLDSPSEWQVASINNDIGDLHMYLEDYEAAEEKLLASLAIWGNPETPWASFPLTNLGFLRNRTGQYAQALEDCSRALALDESTRAADHPDLAYSLSCIGEALIGMGQPEEAIAPLRRSVDIRIPFVSYELAWSRFLLGQALRASGRSEAATDEIASALRLFEEFPSPDPHMTASVSRWRQSHSADATN